ncbi:hypothetical protein CEY16_06780 [Halalkalibacillus sediminis]|uniref:Uncharacterized protein n=1 Tax=Halalkalibacillus sediminis TaxID=2018042 RepID=A0A2I0QTI1_9BACI|nr:hypothetical protein [Halalkalibacillus sediminis]PKR77636.1 hypothetical protein CEY16_06780 [Halalkalibacillus sediminis]
MNGLLLKIMRFGAIFFMIPPLFSFNETGRTGADQAVLVYILLIALGLILIGSIGFYQKINESISSIENISFLVFWFCTPFLMVSQFISLIYLVGVTEPSPELLTRNVEFMPVGALSLGFPIGLILMGIVIFRKGIISGLFLSISASIMMAGLLIVPWVHHVGIICVAAILFFLSKYFSNNFQK